MTACVVFDLDGTLIDTAPDLVETLNTILVREGYPPVAYDDARALIGGGARVMLERGLSLQNVKPDPADVARLYADYLTYYTDHIADRSRPFPGLDSALDELEDRGFRLAVCTNKLEGLSLRLLEALKLRSRFVAICGQDTFGVQKPDPEVLRRTIAAAGADIARAVMVGDSGTDIATARAAGVPIVAVDFGYTDVPVAKLGPDRVISDFRALPDAVLALMQSRT